jgi:hypothetical protein
MEGGFAAPAPIIALHITARHWTIVQAGRDEPRMAVMRTHVTSAGHERYTFGTITRRRDGAEK